MIRNLITALKHIKRKIKHEQVKLKGGNDGMVHEVRGGVICVECGKYHEVTRIMEINPDDENSKTLIECNSDECQGQWRKWK